MKIEGNIAPKNRIVTGLYSFDRAFENQKGEIGFPLGTATEIYGVTHCGKSTITYSLAGMLANQLETNIALVDLEGFDPNFLEAVLVHAGFDNTLYYFNESTDEKSLTSLKKHLSLESRNTNIGILDSIGAISPIAEAEGELGESNMGRRAFLLAQLSRRMIYLLRSEKGSNKALFMINHAYPKIGGRGFDTPGGEVKKYLASIRIQVKRRFVKGKYEEFPDGSYIIEGTIIKNRWGYKDRKFYLFVLAGKGIDLGLTAMYDGIMLKKVSKDKVIKIGDTSFGYLKDIVNQAQEGNTEFFSPFFEVLTDVEKGTDNETDEPEDTPEDADAEQDESGDNEIQD